MQIKNDYKNVNISAVSTFNYNESLKKPDQTFLNKVIKVERYLNRPLASLVVRLVYHTPVTPNGLTFSSFFLGILSAFFLSQGKYIYFILGGVGIQLSSIMDCADGMLARSKSMCSEYGSHLDLFLDRIMDFFMIIGISIGVYRALGDKSLLILGFLTAGLYLLQVNLYYLTTSYLQRKEKGQSGEARAFMLLMVMILGIFNRLDIGLYILLAETVVVNISRLIYFVTLGPGRKES
ncbi:MAG: CDP-alcohol phosphatidyltransferase family protein [Acidobacteria bacterium]|jgi:phosphatidylglycerophosphate synthase|nr:CDP-alcohol phosphatidyltransferase family protein [Acidobacteriota bacterium]